MKTQYTIDVLTKVYKQQGPGEDLITYSERGPQYITRCFRNKDNI